MPVNQDSVGTIWIVTVDPDAPVEPTRRAIENAGLTVLEYLLPASIVIARGTEAQAAKARHIDGVLAVDADMKATIASPDPPAS